MTLQENNAIAILDLKRKSFDKIVSLGFKDHSAAGNPLDASDRDGPGNTTAINIANWPVLGMYQPDTIATYRTRGGVYLVTANEGDARDYTGFSEERRVSALTLDPTAFPNAAALRNNAALGRLNVTSTLGNTDGDADYDKLCAFGARSFAIWSDKGELVFDSGDQLERKVAELAPTFFNSEGATASFDTRSDNKGPRARGPDARVSERGQLCLYRPGARRRRDDLRRYRAIQAGVCAVHQSPAARRLRRRRPGARGSGFGGQTG